MEMFLVGGKVRDMFLGRDSKDWDFSCVLSETETNSWPLGTLQAILTDQGFEVLDVTEDKFTIRARAPKGWTWGPDNIGKTPRVCDFVLARREVHNGGDRQDVTVVAGTLDDDLARRDFTMNAIAMAADGTIIDPFGGRQDIRDGVICSVGMPKQRMREDGLRALRAIRFAITLGFAIDGLLGIELSMRGAWHATRPDISVDRRREELHRAFRHDTIRTIRLLDKHNMLEIAATDGLWLMPTSKAQG